jgi:DNA-binding GntR family transcriptional regulator
MIRYTFLVYLMTTSAHASGPYEQLRDRIIRGRLKPGYQLVEAGAARELGMSRTPIRAALQRLRLEGLVVSVGGGERPRLAVAPLSREAVGELYRAAGALEGLAARAVAELPVAARRKLGASMAAHDARFRRAARATALDWNDLFLHHDAFHRELRTAAAGPQVRALLEALRPQLDRYEWIFAPLVGPDFSATYAEHDEIVRAVVDRPAAQIERAVRANWFNGGERLTAVIEEADASLLTGRWGAP